MLSSDEIQVLVNLNQGNENATAWGCDFGQPVQIHSRSLLAPSPSLASILVRLAIYAVEFEIDGKICRLGGMAKGSGMIHPNMATTLNF